MGHHGICTNNRAPADLDSFSDCDMSTNPNIVSNRHRGGFHFLQHHRDSRVLGSMIMVHNDNIRPNHHIFTDCNLFHRDNVTSQVQARVAPHPESAAPSFHMAIPADNDLALEFNRAALLQLNLDAGVNFAACVDLQIAAGMLFDATGFINNGSAGNPRLFQSPTRLTQIYKG